MTQRQTANMVYWEEGRGAPLVLVHGALSDHRAWEKQIAPLASDYRVLAVSLRGYVPTQDQAGKASAQRHVDDLVAFLRDDIGEPVTLVGHSRGGRVALEVAARARDHVISLIAFEPGGVAEPDFFGPPAAPQSNVSANGSANAPADIRPAVKQLVEAGQKHEAMARYVDFGHGEGTWNRLPVWYRDILADNAHTIDMMIVDSTVKMSRRVCAEIACPIHLIGGDRSPPIFGRTIDVIQSVRPEAKRTTVPGDHFANACESATFNTALHACLSGP